MFHFYQPVTSVASDLFLFICRFGRKISVVGYLISIATIGLITAFSVNMEMYVALRCLMSIPTVGVYDSSNTIGKLMFVK